MTTQDLEEKEKEEEDEFRTGFDVFPGGSGKSSVKATDSVTKIYACATMWHESREEMLEMLKSLYRVDSDYSARYLYSPIIHISRIITSGVFHKSTLE